MEVNGLPWNYNFHYISFHIPSFWSSNRLVKKDKGEWGSNILGCDFLKRVSKTPYSSIEAANLTGLCVREVESLGRSVRRLTGTAKSSFFPYPGFLHIPAFNQLVLQFKYFNLINFLTEWTYSPWVTHGGFQETMKSLKLPLDTWKNIQEQWDMRVSGRKNRLKN